MKFFLLNFRLELAECNRSYLNIMSQFLEFFLFKMFYFSLISADLGDSLVVTICVRTFHKMSFDAKLPEILPG